MRYLTLLLLVGVLGIPEQSYAHKWYEGDLLAKDITIGQWKDASFHDQMTTVAELIKVSNPEHASDESEWSAQTIRVWKCVRVALVRNGQWIPRSEKLGHRLSACNDALSGRLKLPTGGF